MRAVITGIGVVSPAGTGREAFWERLLKDRPSFVEAAEAGSKDSRRAVIKGFDFERLFADRRFRRAATVTKYALAATDEALKDACLTAPGEAFEKRAGVVTGVTHGALGYSAEFHKGLLADGPSGASPALFSDSVLNANTGSISLAHGIKGPSHTLIGGSPVGLQALSFGAGLIGSGMLDLCVISSAEALAELATGAYSKAGLVSKNGAGPFGAGSPGFIPGEGACTIIIESLEGAIRRGANVLCEVRGSGLGSGGALEGNIRGAFEKTLSRAGAERGDIDQVVTNANGGANDAVEGRFFGPVLREGVMVSGIKAAFGEAFGAGSLMSVAAAALSIERQRALPWPEPLEALPEWSWAQRAGTHCPEDKAIDNSLVSSLGLLGEAGFIFLKRL